MSPQAQRVRFDFNFQVWRPSPIANKSGCYSLVDNFIVTSISITTKLANEHVARVTPSPQDQLHFKPGDVLGFYVESHNAGSDFDNGVVLLNNGSHTSELVWFASIDTTAQTSQSGSCPYPVGTTGVLNLSTHAAPVISVSMTTYSCSPITTTYYTLNSLQHPPIPNFSPSNELSAKSTTSTKYLVLRVAVSVIALVGVAIITTIIITVIIGRHKNPRRYIPGKERHGLTKEQALSDELHVYDYPTAVNTANSIQLKSNVAYTRYSDESSQ